MTDRPIIAAAEPHGLPATTVPVAHATTMLRSLGPGLVTGAADDDPSGIANYSQVGAQFGFGLAWTMLFSYSLMRVFRELCAPTGAVPVPATDRRCVPG